MRATGGRGRQLGKPFSDPDQERQKKRPTKIEKKLRNFMFRAGCSLSRAKGFSYSLVVQYGGLEISKFQFLINTIAKKIFSCNFFTFFLALVPGLDESGSKKH